MRAYQAFYPVWARLGIEFGDDLFDALSIALRTDKDASRRRDNDEVLNADRADRNSFRENYAAARIDLHRIPEQHVSMFVDRCRALERIPCTHVIPRELGGHHEDVRRALHQRLVDGYSRQVGKELG